MRRGVCRFIVAVLAMWAGMCVAAGRTTLLDDFSDASPWKATASDDVKARMRVDGAKGLCLDYDFGGVSGYAVLRRELPLDLPDNFAFDLRMRGEGAGNDFQFKLIDASGDNVWWINRPSFGFTRHASDLRIKKRHVSFAWGPTADRNLRHTAAVEFVVVARAGGHGSVCFERLSLTTLDPVQADAPARISGAWRSSGGGRQHLTVDFPSPREFNGMLVRWLPGMHASDYDLEASDDSRHWRVVRRVRDSDGRTDALFLPESEARHLRLRLLRGPGRAYGIDSIELRSPQQWPDANAMWRSVAESQPRGHHPRAFHGEQNYWTVVGVDGGGAHAALISEDGAIEPSVGGPSIEPYVQVDDGALLAWSDVKITQGLRDGYLPLPHVQWQHADASLAIEAAAAGRREASRLFARYTVTNPSDRPRALTLVLALRPWQVNPPQQFLNTPGGASPIRSVQWRQGVLEVNGAVMLRPLRTPRSVTARAFDSGSVVSAVAERTAMPALTRLDDPNGMASAALSFRMRLAPHGSEEVVVEMPLAGPLQALQTQASADAQIEQMAASWRERLNRVGLELPATAKPIHDSLRTAVAHILISRDGAALQPGTRAYARSWIRDGAMMVAGLLRMGEVQAAHEFVDWYAGMLFANGKVPCCVDHRGADPVVENDSAGEFIYAVAQLWRHTHDRATLERLWPKVEAATRHMESLRQSERIAANKEGARTSWWGLMPASISHEGYSDKPMHSYWDDFWALRGYKDAAQIAGLLGRVEQAAQFAIWRDEFEHELIASIRTSSSQHRIDYIGGAAELGDFDATSTTIALSLAQVQERLPQELLQGTFERYWNEAAARRDGKREWSDYTPYELRTIGALVRLGQPDRAHQLLAWFFGHQRPAGWNQWAEVVGSKERQPRFLGDMPHAWISSDFIRSALDMLAFERESDHSLVIAAGVPRHWLREGVAVKGMSTAHGPLSYRLRQQGDNIRLQIEEGLTLPPGGIVLAWPGDEPLPRATVDGRHAEWSGRELHITHVPALVTLTR